MSASEKVNRRQLPGTIERVVIKVGTFLLTGRKTPLNSQRIKAIVDQIAAVRAGGIEVALVTSGAIGAGIQDLGWKRRPRDIPGLQAAAAVGQSALMHIYHDYFRAAQIGVGQILLTREDLHHRTRHLNICNTLHALLKRGVIPIINENDTVAVDEIRFGDNDFLAALVANLIQADLLIMLTDVEGLLRPGENPNDPRLLIPRVDRITPEVMELIEDRDNEYSRGGMRSKIEAAGIVTRAGGQAVIADGRCPEVIAGIISGKEIGTFFPTRFKRMRSRKSWIAFSRLQKGSIIVDRGARRALIDGGKSLLSTGITGVSGNFADEDMVGIRDEDGEEFARGLVNYSSEEIKKIRGEKTERIKDILGYRRSDEVIHRDDLLIL